jgi:hypothetical protein
MLEFTLYWLNGKLEIIKGFSISDAFEKAGYDNDAIKGLYLYEGGATPKYVWLNNSWQKQTSTS